MIRIAACAALAALTSIAGAMVIDPVDPAFGVALAEIQIAANGARAELIGMALAPDGRIAALTVRPDSTACDAVTVVMFTAQGQVDTGFGSNGRAAAAMLGLPSCVTPRTTGFAFDAGGNLYLTAKPDADPAQRVWKATASGAADPSFGTGGSAPLPMVHSILGPTLQVLGDGSVAVGGTAIFINALGQREPALAVARLRPDGSVDTGYGTSGIASASPANRPIHDAEGAGMSFNADGTVLVAGNIFEDNAGAKLYYDATVARFDARGRLDLAYGDAGFAIPLRDASTFAQSLAVVGGEAYLAGVQSRDVPFAFVAKIKANGQADLAFGSAGAIGTDQFRETSFEPRVAVDAARRVYVVLSDSRGHVRITRYRGDGQADVEFGLGGAAYVAVGGWNFGNRTALVLAGNGVPYVGAGTFPATDDVSRAAVGIARVNANGGQRAGIAGGTAIVYYHQGLDHYFLTANPAEQASLDSGATVGWRRTGDAFRVVTSSAADPELSPVCRYYGRPEAHLDSHFFSAARDECDAVAQKFSASWLLETSQAFQVQLADRTTGACPRGSEKIVRAFDNRTDANHYYGPFANAPPGWTYEGYGPGPIPTAFCAPLL